MPPSELQIIRYCRPFDNVDGSVPISSLLCNILWFLSLGFSLICALSATLVEQWARKYLQATYVKPAPQQRARLSAYLFEGIEKYKMSAIVETIPMLLHISLFLFFAGLVALLHNVNRAIQCLCLGMLVFCSALYFFVTLLPIIQLSSPFSTPFSTLLWTILRRLRLLYRRDADGNRVAINCHMKIARELDAMEPTTDHDRRDLRAMSWAVTMPRENNEFEPFVEVIPSVVAGFDYTAKWLMDELINHEDNSIRLANHIPRLLASCTTGILDPLVAQKRAITSVKAIWSLNMLSMPKHTSSNPNDSYHSKGLKFREDTFDLLSNVGKVLPNSEVHGLISSASVVVARSLLDMQMDRVDALEAKLLNILEFGQIHPRHHNQEEEYQLRSLLYYQQEVLDASTHKVQELEEQVLFTHHLTTPVVHVIVEAIAIHHTRLANLANSSRFGFDTNSVEQVLKSIKRLKSILNQAGFNLVLEYVRSMLGSDGLPHEAFNTLRRTFFRINIRSLGFTSESQERLVLALEDAVEQTSSGTSRLPLCIISILLSMTRALDEPALIVKAIGIIKGFSIYSLSDKACTVLQALERALPRKSHVPLPTLDIFRSHLYADSKVAWTVPKTRSNTMETLV